MPTAMHPQAKFDPIPPDLDLHALVDGSPNFDWVVRISLPQIRRLGSTGFEKLVQLHVIEGGRPLVIEGWNRLLPESIFSAKWLEQTYNKKQENVRDLCTQSDIPMTMGHYLRSMRQLTNQWSPTNFRDERRQRLYLKDIDCPPEWFEHLRKIIPPNVLYMNENVSENNGADVRPDDDIFGASESSAAVAGDLMSCLPEEMRAQNLMCYIGHEGTYTPAHKEMCATLGQNIMVEASGSEDGNKPGSSVWFMTETKDREVVREYFLSMLGHDVEIEKHFAQINAWKKANFPVYVVEQKVGDFILIPPLAPHQVWNRGTRTMKVAWNRVTPETLDLALHEALPRSRLVCRDEQYKTKATVYYALEKYYKELQSAEDSAESSLLGLGRELANSPRLKQIAGDFRRLFGLFTEVLVDEMFGYKQVGTEFIEFDSNITCSYCRSNIFNRFLTCKCCVRQLINGDEDTYDVCMECYAMGRSCVCVSGLQWCEQWQWSDLVDKHEMWRAMVIKQDGFVDLEYSPQPLELARKKTGKKCVAQICQEQLRRRPWNDITKPAVNDTPQESEAEPEVDDEGRIRKKKKPSRKPKKGDTYRCHVCCHKDYTYRLNYCTTCQEAYCYGVLFRAFDTMPQAAMEQENWQCPRCLGICNCGSCKRTGNTKPYVPKSTLLGHDTRKVADDRSVESIVDFRIHNLGWLKGAGEETRGANTKRMLRLKEQADAEKARDPLVALDAADDAPRDMDSALQASVTSGENSHGFTPVNGDANDHQVQMADMGHQNVEGNSAYPDPTYPSPSTGGRMMGMGFYDQENSADPILFDAFQMPSAEALENEPEVSEFVKKTLRMAKRKARLETNDDPDFQGPRSHHRKKLKTGNIDQLVNLDPALLGTLGDPSGSQRATSTRPEVSSAEGHTAHEARSEQPGTVEKPKQKPVRTQLPRDPLRPQLRHAKPAQSYVEAEDVGEDPEDIVPVDLVKLVGTENEPSATNNPVDLAAEAIRTLTHQDGMSYSRASQQAKKRGPGRPPALPRPWAPAVAPESTVVAPRRGRLSDARPPRESNGDSTHDGEDTAMDVVPTTSNGAAVEVDGLEAELGAALMRGGDNGKVQVPDPSLTVPSMKRRGRPPGRKSMPATAVEVEAEPMTLPAAPRMMSMAEKMAARKRGFKMGKTGGRPSLSGNSSSATTTANELIKAPPKPVSGAAASVSSGLRDRKHIRDNKSQAAPEGSSSDESSDHDKEAARRPVRNATGFTVVRMEESDDSFSSSESDSVFDDDDEDGIPAKPTFTVSRGRGRGRGVGRGRPKGRGRGHG
ncbi:hypothetical protein BKA67DRAFT_687910 [Truncatella angustata]|uniref:JmjC domain-containing protein n=1 Tax=Truncatella angustata TaxID=152316 RepID=A0A9P8UPF8_9PEZI|nr:uncharacterized protein BKA67DRAFT_687910 [Truncatella angustata]KAH6656470.1 hypothetical protein BKA67DRAFT_687910 [Truncatella angustata]KAH8203244.1 hypothetical protein TruAng_002542 [Truncatella angustata]